MSRPKILIVDDEASLVEFLTVLCSGEGYEVSSARSVGEARERLAASSPDLVLSDMVMPDGDGLDLLREIRADGDGPVVLMMTAYTSTRTAIEAMKLGAYDYVAKPFDVDELKVVLRKALENRRITAENVYLKGQLARRYTFANIIGRSLSMQAVFSLVERVANTSSTVLVHGESGTGKELIARAIHFASARADHRFLSINCGAIPEQLLESELFGHERGAFTGAVRDKKGLFLEANRGTLFLDEIGEMSLSMQVKLLRALQDRTIRRVGGAREEPIDVRIIAATNRDLQDHIARGDFREDLYYRINVIPITIPPLRDRREDIPLLVEHFLRKLADETAQEPRKVSPEAIRLLEGHDWPGNVRELENLVERAVALATSDTIDVADFPRELLEGSRSPVAQLAIPDDGMDLERHLDEIRLSLMRQALDRAGGVQTKAAELLGMTFRSFRYYAKKIGVTAVSPGD